MSNEIVGNGRKDPGGTDGRHILLVDDDLSYLKMVRGWLSEKYQITAAKSGNQALAYLEGHAVDLILLDFEMPEMNGPQVLLQIRQKPQAAEIPVAFLTGSSDQDAVQRDIGQSVSGYLLKTMDRDSIVKAIDNFFRSGLFSTETEDEL